MTSRQLVRAAIARKLTDRVPHLLDITPTAWEAIASRIEADSVEAFFDNDVLDVCPPWWSFDFARRPADWLDTRPPTTELPIVPVGTLEGLHDRVRALREADNDKYLLVRLYGIHFEQGAFARGYGNFMLDMATGTDFARRFLNDCVERNLAHMEQFLSLEDIDGVLLGSDWGSDAGLLMSPKMFDEMIRPGEQRMIDAIHAAGKSVWLHCCGDVRELMPTIIEMGYDVLNPIEPECMDLLVLKEEFGSQICFWGGISTRHLLPQATPDEVRTEARRIRGLLGDGGGYIFAPAQYIQEDVPLANILALLEVAREGRQIVTA